MNEQTLKQLTAVQAEHAQSLMEKAHVVAVGIGYAQVNGNYTDTPALVVMVDEKLPPEALQEADLLPRELDGVRVDVVAVGTFSAG